MLLFREEHFVFIFVQDKHLFFPHLIHIASHYLTNDVGILFIESLFLKFKNTRSQSLTEVKNGTTTKTQKLHFVHYLFTHLIVLVYLLSCCKCNLHALIFQLIILYNSTRTKYLAVTCFRVDNNIIILISSIHFSYHATERIFQNTDQSRAINRLQILEFRKGFNKIYFLFFSHFFKSKVENRKLKIENKPKQVPHFKFLISN